MRLWPKYSTESLQLRPSDLSGVISIFWFSRRNSREYSAPFQVLIATILWRLFLTVLRFFISTFFFSYQRFSDSKSMHTFACSCKTVTAAGGQVSIIKRTKKKWRIYKRDNNYLYYLAIDFFQVINDGVQHFAWLDVWNGYIASENAAGR